MTYFSWALSQKMRNWSISAKPAWRDAAGPGPKRAKPGPSKAPDWTTVCAHGLTAAIVPFLLATACGKEVARSAPEDGGGGAGGETHVQAGSAGAAGAAAASENFQRFSFFVTSYKAIATLSGNVQGFGGDLRFGESGDGAGLRGADKICALTAERSAPDNGKTWRAFLSTSRENAIDRIGNGPFYDRLGRIVARQKSDLLATRPIGADSAIINDLPNEDGVPNHAPDGTLVDNHDTLTGTNKDGTLYAEDAACSDWTSAEADHTKQPRVGHMWPSVSSRDHLNGDPTSNIEGMSHWISALDESGCSAGVNLLETGSPGTEGTVGSGGGYGAIYCFGSAP